MQGTHWILAGLLLARGPSLLAQVGQPIDRRLIVEDGRYEESEWTRQLAVTADSGID